MWSKRARMIMIEKDRKMPSDFDKNKCPGSRKKTIPEASSE